MSTLSLLLVALHSASGPEDGGRASPARADAPAVQIVVPLQSESTVPTLTVGGKKKAGTRSSAEIRFTLRQKGAAWVRLHFGGPSSNGFRMWLPLGVPYEVEQLSHWGPRLTSPRKGKACVIVAHQALATCGHFAEPIPQGEPMDLDEFCGSEPAAQGDLRHVADVPFLPALPGLYRFLLERGRVKMEFQYREVADCAEFSGRP